MQAAHGNAAPNLREHSPEGPEVAGVVHQLPCWAAPDAGTPAPAQEVVTGRPLLLHQSPARVCLGASPLGRASALPSACLSVREEERVATDLHHPSDPVAARKRGRRDGTQERSLLRSDHFRRAVE